MKLAIELVISGYVNLLKYLVIMTMIPALTAVAHYLVSATSDSIN